MMGISLRWLCCVWWVVIVVSAVGCATSSAPPQKAGTSQAAQGAAATQQPPTLEELANATYRGILPEPVKLTDGAWESEPLMPGAASRTRVTLVQSFDLLSDLDGDGLQERIALLASNSGGSGTFGYIAVMTRRGDQIIDLGTAKLGDRVRVRVGRSVGDKLQIDVIQAGPQDAACCPSQKATRTFTLRDAALVEGPVTITGTLSLADLDGTHWILKRFAWNAPVPPEPKLSLAFDGTRITGSSGCNRFSTEAKEGKLPGEMSVGLIAGTRMACPEQVMALEDRFLETLGAVHHYTFLTGNLILSWTRGDVGGTMIFVPKAASD